MVLLLLSSMLLFTACDDDEITDPVAENPLGTLDFTRYIAVGNSLTAGFQSGALLIDGQDNSYPKLITDQISAADDTTYTMRQPLLAYPGIGNEAGVGVLELSFDSLNNAVVERSSQAPASMPSVEAPYHNLGVPGAYTSDVTTATGGANSRLQPLGSPNGYFDVLIQGAGKTQADLLVEANPTFVTLWIGNNDVLGYATSGGDVTDAFLSAVLTDDGEFKAAWLATADSIDATGAKAITANIPNITDIPFFTTVPFEVDVQVPDVVIVTLPLQYIEDGETVAATAADLILLTASSLIGVPDSLGNAFGISNLNPLPDALVLSSAEQSLVSASIAHHNTFIEEQAAARGWGFVDFNAIFADISINGFVQGSTTLTTDFIMGNLFSLDGIHPTGKGYGIIANEFLKVMDTQFGATITKVDIGTLPGVPGQSFSKLALNPFTKTPIFSKGAFDHLNVLFGGRK